MKQILISRHGGPEVLQVVEKPDPQPRRKEAIIEVKAAGINFADILARRGLYLDAPPPPCVVGYEVSGTVLATGDDVDPALQGRDVVAMTRFGGYSDRIAVQADHLIPKPESISFS